MVYGLYPWGIITWQGSYGAEKTNKNLTLTARREPVCTNPTRPLNEV